MKGHSTDAKRALTDDKIIMRLGGKSYRQVDPRSPYVFNADRCSYGMSNQVPGQVFSPRQMMIMDANMTDIRVGEPGWMGHVMARHSGRVNYVTTGGAVQSANSAELMREYDRLEDKGDASGSLWGRQADPVAKD